MEIVSALLFILLLIREVISYRERTSMLDRLMAKSLPEFKDNVKTEENKLDPIDDTTVSIEEAEEDILNNGQETE